MRNKLFSKKVKVTFLILAGFVGAIYIESCTKTDGLVQIDNAAGMHDQLSAYNIFQGNPSDLVPAAGYKLYELASELFTDYAEKQRLIKLPAGQILNPVNDGLPEFPDGTIMVKTFYYFHDKRNLAAGKRIIETRLLIKSGDKWSVGTYLWNEAQTEAKRIGTGLNTTVNWIDENGKGNVISYQVPRNTECNTCHQSNDKIIPIGPKMRNLNRIVTRSGSDINQLQHLQNEGIFPAINPKNFSSLPAYADISVSVDLRARAYLDVNCSHCHNHKGFAENTDLFLTFETPFDDTDINKRKKAIIRRMERGQMPKLGTTMVHKEGLELLKSYIETLD